MNKIIYFFVLSFFFLPFESRAMEESEKLSPIAPCCTQPIEEKQGVAKAKRSRSLRRENAFEGTETFAIIDSASRAAAAVGAYLKEKHGGEIPSLEGANTKGLSFIIPETSSTLSQSLESISKAMQGKIFTDDLSSLAVSKFKKPDGHHRPHRKSEGIPSNSVSPPRPAKQERSFVTNTPLPKRQKISNDQPTPGQNLRKKPQG